MTRWTAVLVLVIGLGATGCKDEETLLREELAADGMLDIKLTPIKRERGVYRVRAMRGDERCKGEYGAEGNSRGDAFNNVVCVPPPGPIQQALPESAGEKAHEMAAGCDRGEDDACAELAEMFATGDQVATDLGRASEMHRALCDKGRQDSCAAGPVMAARAERDLEKARPLFGKACEAGSAESCATAAKMFLTGIGGATDETLGRGHAAMGCDGGHDGACGWLGVAFYGGMGGERKPEEGKKLMRRGCDAGHKDVCAILDTAK